MAPNRFIKANVSGDAQYKGLLLFHVQTKMENGKILPFLFMKKPSLEYVQNFQYPLPRDINVFQEF